MMQGPGFFTRLIFFLLFFIKVRAETLLRHTLVNSDGAVYDGEMERKGIFIFRTDKKHGRGVMTWPDGHKFDGNWRNDKPHGLGTMTYPNGDTLKAEFHEDGTHGPALITYANGDKYEGAH